MDITADFQRLVEGFASKTVVEGIFSGKRSRIITQQDPLKV